MRQPVNYNLSEAIADLKVNRKKLDEMKTRLNEIEQMWNNLEEAYDKLNRIFWGKRFLRKLYLRNTRINGKLSKNEKENFKILRTHERYVEKDHKQYCIKYKDKINTLRRKFNYDLPKI